MSTATAPTPAAKDAELLASRRNWITEMRECMMIVAGTVAWCAFRACLNPPGGFWRDDKDGHVAGEPVMLTRFPDSYTGFRMCSAMALHTSVIIMVLLSNERFYRTWEGMTTLVLLAVFDLACFLGVYAIGSSPQDPIRALAYFLPAIIICVLSYSLLPVGRAIGKLVRRLAKLR